MTVAVELVQPVEGNWVTMDGTPADQATDTPDLGDDTWDAAWAEAYPPETVTIRGIDVLVPRGMLLETKERLERQDGRTGWDAWGAVVVELLRAPDGSEIPALCQQWRAAGMFLAELEALTIWAWAHAEGAPITFQAAIRVQREHAAGAGRGKAKTPGATSGATGGRSRRPSRPRTGSTSTPSGS